MTINELTEKFEQAKNDLREFGKDALSQSVKELFDRYPDVNKFSVDAYTPYFNDGEPCNYSVRSYTSRVNDYNNDYGEWNEEDNGSDQETLDKALTEFIDLIDSVPEEMFEYSFEEGRITFYRDGKTESEDYDHD